VVLRSAPSSGASDSAQPQILHDGNISSHIAVNFSHQQKVADMLPHNIRWAQEQPCLWPCCYCDRCSCAAQRNNAAKLLHAHQA
jgi:hypothetical protein